MKIRSAIVLSCLIGVVVLCVGYEYGRGAPTAGTSTLKIGVVSIQRIFQDSTRNAKYMKEAIAEQRRLEGQLDKLIREIEAERERVKALKPGSSDYLASMKQILEKEGKLKAQRDFYKLQMESKDLRWNEALYKDILREIGEVARQRNLDLVLEKSEPELPALSAMELKVTVRMHKLLYSGGCLDITGEVLARLDAEDSGGR